MKAILWRTSGVGGRLLGLRKSLQWRVLTLVTIGLAVILGAFSVTSLLAVDESTDRALAEREALAETTAGHVDYVITQNLRALDEVPFAEGFDLEDADTQPERDALRRTYFTSIFSGGVYLLSQQGHVLWVEPAHAVALGTDLLSSPHVLQALESAKPAVSGLTTGLVGGGPAVSIVSPVRSPSGQLVGLVGGDIDLMGSYLRDVVRYSALGRTGYAQIVDGQGVVLASTRLGEVLQKNERQNELATLIQEGRTASATCHDCGQETAGVGREAEVIAFSPLVSAPWGVVIRQAESEALAPARRLRERAMWLGIASFGLALLFAWGTVRSVTRPISVLTQAAQKIASGELSERVPDLGEDEIGRLARAFETMRTKLKASLEHTQAWSKELERRVRQRTRELEASRDHLRQVAEENAALYEELKQKEALRGQLLKKVITAQEEERRRIARELHDETSQALAALAVGLETVTLRSPLRKAEVKEKLAGLQGLAVQTLEGVHNLVYDLRPSILDDLGLVASLQWYAENRLQPTGVAVHLEVSGQERRLPAEIETALFRIGQEAISNIVRHAEAANVFVSVDFEDSAIALDVEDDGKGFAVDAVAEPPAGPTGWGILGMKERTALLGGAVGITSQPGGGTHVQVKIPLDERKRNGEQDSGGHSR
ncbi:MAG: HAMP domain-containing protein [Chloroflexota bacterium]|nr:HAMP domain-containing protein [Chloroflexota bacterium]